ncbi:hypothetical protein CPC08DRAFT_458034 [Agrocybe pediades]|nr:hypothetical protein CPC08DRAFT_458034 [Agrocybe pediades]
MTCDQPKSWTTNVNHQLQDCQDTLAVAEESVRRTQQSISTLQKRVKQILNQCCSIIAGPPPLLRRPGSLTAIPCFSNVFRSLQRSALLLPPGIYRSFHPTRTRSCRTRACHPSAQYTRSTHSICPLALQPRPFLLSLPPPPLPCHPTQTSSSI